MKTEDFNLQTKLIFDVRIKYFCMLMKRKFDEELLNNNLYYMKKEQIRRCYRCKMKWDNPNYLIAHGYYNNFDHWSNLGYEENDNLCNCCLSEEITIFKPIRENITGFYLLSEENKVLKIHYDPYDEDYFRENIQQSFGDFDEIINKHYFINHEMNIISKIVENIEYMSLPSTGYYWNSPLKPIQ